MGVKGEERTFKLQNYEVSVSPISEKQLGIQVIDSVRKIEFAENELTLEKIGTSTLLMALEGVRKEVSITPTYRKEGEFDLLELTIRIESAFLKTIEEKIFIKKIRDVDEMEIINRKMKSIGQKMRAIKEKEVSQDGNFYSFEMKEQSFNGAGYEPVASIKLKKGKYLITFSFQLKATNQWLYLYLGQESIISNAGFYVPSTSSFMPFTIRVIKTITEDEKNLEFTTNAASSYPAILRNRIITAQKLPN